LENCRCEIVEVGILSRLQELAKNDKIKSTLVFPLAGKAEETASKIQPLMQNKSIINPPRNSN